MPSLKEKSPLGIYIDHLNKGELAYQVTETGEAVFYPRVIAPKTGSANLTWKVSKGLGTVHATTVVCIQKDTPPYNVALIDVDEGFRMMSRVEDIEPMQVKIGMRVKFRVHPGTEKDSPYPVFTTLTPDLSPKGREEGRASLLPPGEGSGMRDGRAQ